MEFDLIFTANAGMILETDGLCIAVDAFHNQRALPFSTLPKDLLPALAESGVLSRLDALFFSHTHSDHYGKSAVEQVLPYAPKASFLAPESLFPRQILLQGPAVHIALPDGKLDAVRLVHDGPEYREVPLYGLLLTLRNQRILFPGDSTDHAGVRQMTQGQPVDVAVLNFPWITLPGNRRFVEQELAPRHLILTHLPYPDDDTEGFISATRKAAEKLTAIPDIRLLTCPLQKETLSCF